VKKIKIITDSSCDLNKDIVEKYNIEIVRLNVSFGEETYVDGEMDNATFYSRMASEKQLPKTSCPSPEKFAESYDCDEDEILVITLTSKLSGTYSTAVLARNIFLEENTGKRIEIIDSANGSVGQGLLVVKAAQMAQEGKSLDEIVEEIERIKDDVIFYGSLETLDNAIKGGRVNPVAGKLINVLNMKMIVKVGNGEVKPIDTARGSNNSIKKVIGKISDVISEGNYTSLAIAHANCLDKAEKIKEMILKDHKFDEITISEIGSVMGVYAAEGAVLVSVL
jgi:DegV family protein with EDD domain